MTSQILISTVLYKLLALGTALGVIGWAADASVRAPEGQVALYTQHPQRLGIALALLLAPIIVSLSVWAVVGSYVYQHPHAVPISMAISTVLSMFAGVVYGASASCLLAPRNSGEAPRWKLAMSVAAGMLLVPPLFGLGIVLHHIVHYLIVATILVVGYALTRGGIQAGVGADGRSATVQPAGSPAVALMFAFAPTALLLIAVTLAATGLTDSMSDDLSRVLLAGACVASIVCCFISSRMLFSRKTAGAVTGGVLLLLLNALVVLAFGFAALLIGVSFH